MSPRMWVSLGVLAGTTIAFALTKKRDWRCGFGVGCGAAMLAQALLDSFF